MNKPIVWSYGGGTQSAAIAVLIAQGRLPKPEVSVIADTGREGSKTWTYLNNHIQPLMDTVGVKIEIASHDLATVDLYAKNGDLLIPAYTATGKLPTFCSTEWKARVVSRYLRGIGYGPMQPVRTWIGFSLDEIHRVKQVKGWQEYWWPLLFDVQPALTREDCRRLVVSAGLPEPPKSSCLMCPHRQNEQWADLRDNAPEDWAAAVALDKAIRERDQAGGVYLHNSRVPLDQADLSVPPEPEHPLFGRGEGCETSAGCWT